MALIRWEPVGELNTIQNEMNRLFNTFFDESTPTGRAGSPPAGDGSGDGPRRNLCPEPEERARACMADLVTTTEVRSCAGSSQASTRPCADASDDSGTRVRPT